MGKERGCVCGGVMFARRQSPAPGGAMARGNAWLLSRLRRRSGVGERGRCGRNGCAGSRDAAGRERDADAAIPQGGFGTDAAFGVPVGTPRSVCVPFSGSSIDAFLFYRAGSPSPQHPACARLLNHGGRKIHTFFNPNALPGWRAALPERWQHATALGGSRAGFVPWGGPRPGLGWGPRSPPQHPSGRS